MPQLTRAQAEALLPRIKPYLEDIQRRKRAYDRRPSDAVAAELRALATAVAELGAIVKDLDQGLVDFPATFRGRDIYLCWKLGEGDRIWWWHDVDSGFRGRQRIEVLVEN